MENCTVINQSSDTFHMKCLPGFDGGMNQTFHILVRDRQTNNVKYDNASLTKPELIIGKPKYLLEKFYVLHRFYLCLSDSEICKHKSQNILIYKIRKSRCWSCLPGCCVCNKQERIQPCSLQYSGDFTEARASVDWGKNPFASRNEQQWTDIGSQHWNWHLPHTSNHCWSCYKTVQLWTGKR